MAPKIGYLLPTRESIMEGRPETGPLLALAEKAEKLGYDSVWVGESLLARPRHEPITLLAGVAVDDLGLADDVGKGRGSPCKQDGQTDKRECGQLHCEYRPHMRYCSARTRSTSASASDEPMSRRTSITLRIAAFVCPVSSCPSLQASAIACRMTLARPWCLSMVRTMPHRSRGRQMLENTI